MLCTISNLLKMNGLYLSEPIYFTHPVTMSFFLIFYFETRSELWILQNYRVAMIFVQIFQLARERSELTWELFQIFFLLILILFTNMVAQDNKVDFSLYENISHQSIFQILPMFCKAVFSFRHWLITKQENL